LKGFDLLLVELVIGGAVVLDAEHILALGPVVAEKQLFAVRAFDVGVLKLDDAVLISQPYGVGRRCGGDEHAGQAQHGRDEDQQSSPINRRADGIGEHHSANPLAAIALCFMKPGTQPWQSAA
jgi:hypothetical protein